MWKYLALFAIGIFIIVEGLRNGESINLSVEIGVAIVTAVAIVYFQRVIGINDNQEVLDRLDDLERKIDVTIDYLEE